VPNGTLRGVRGRKIPPYSIYMFKKEEPSKRGFFL